MYINSAEFTGSVYRVAIILLITYIFTHIIYSMFILLLSKAIPVIFYSLEAQ
jgi:hypothetical protein